VPDSAALNNPKDDLYKHFMNPLFDLSTISCPITRGAEKRHGQMWV